MALRWTRELRALLEECEVTTYRASGKGGQKRNKTESAVRVVHLPTGITRIGTESRSQSANKLRALDRVREAIEERNRKPKPRRATQPSAAARDRRLAEKRQRAETKRGRAREIEE